MKSKKKKRVKDEKSSRKTPIFTSSNREQTERCGDERIVKVQMAKKNQQKNPTQISCKGMMS